MKIQVLNQKAGHDPIGDEINRLLARKRRPFDHVKFLMAFVNKDGLRYIKDELERRYDSGLVVEFIVGIDNGITTHDALSYLKRRFPDASLFVFHDKSPRKVFHHKLVILENEHTLVCVVGSANLTLGGMFSNFESAIVGEFDKIKDAECVASLARTWDAYRNPRTPLHPSNLQELTSSWLKKHAPELRKSAKRHKQRSGTRGFTGFAATPLPTPKLSSWPTQPKRRKPRKMRETATIGKGKRLFVQVLKETGADGTQIQIPREALTDYFKGSMKRPIAFRIQFRGGGFRDGYIYHFDNNTHRISIRELSGVKRPAMLVFERLPLYQKSYRCSVLTARKHDAALKFCDQQTREGAKKWGVAD